MNLHALLLADDSAFLSKEALTSYDVTTVQSALGFKLTKFDKF